MCGCRGQLWWDQAAAADAPADSLQNVTLITALMHFTLLWSTQTQEGTSHTHTHTQPSTDEAEDCVSAAVLSSFSGTACCWVLVWLLIRRSASERSFVFGQITLPSRHSTFPLCECVSPCSLFKSIMMNVDLLLTFAVLESPAACGHRCFTSCDQTPFFFFYIFY